MEVYSDFQCPACRQLFFESVKPLMDDYVHTGKVYYIHRDTPLSIHPYARDAARYANAAGQLGKFEKVAEVIYASQPAWSVDRSKLDTAVATALTSAEMNQVRASLLSSAVETAIEKDLSAGRAVPVTSTPTVVLTHKGQRIPLLGGVTYPLLRRVLDQLLAQR
jgi:protein-disulfide isomerase